MNDSRLPMPVMVTATLVLLALLGWNIIVDGPDGYAQSAIIGGLLSVLFGTQRLLGRSDRVSPKDED